VRARAPGKLVLSGAYSVLWGAPALVCAVSRYAVADTERAPEHVGAELGRAIELGYLPFAPYVDVSALRAPRADGVGTRKLGLGSSAALLAAALAAFEASPLDDARRMALFDRARRVHREAQGGGSGVDVAAAVFGGVLRARSTPSRARSPPNPARCRPRRGSESSPQPSPQRHPHSSLVFGPTAKRSDLASTSSSAARGVAPSSPRRPATQPRSRTRSTNSAKRSPSSAELAQAPIVTESVARLAALARSLGEAHFGPSGAGGGDVALYVGSSAPPRAFVASAEREGYAELALDVGAPGVEPLPSPTASHGASATPEPRA
jgi:phosphomevalonate kinase